MHFCDSIGPKCYLIKCSRLNKCIIFKKKQKYQVKSVFTKFHLTNIKGMRADRCSSFGFSLLRKCLHDAWLYHKARSNSRENYYGCNDTDFMFGAIYKLSKFQVIYANDSLAYHNLQRDNKNLEGPINTWLYACV